MDDRPVIVVQQRQYQSSGCFLVFVILLVIVTVLALTMCGTCAAVVAL